MRKKWRIDRKLYSKYNSLSSVMLDHVNNVDVRKERFVLPSVKTIHWQNIQKNTLGCSFMLKRNSFNWGDKIKYDEKQKLFTENGYISVGKKFTAQYLGKAPTKVGRTPTKVHSISDVGSVFFRSKYCPERCRVNEAVENISISGGFDGTLQHFSKFSRERSNDIKSLNKVKLAIDRVTKRFSQHCELNVPHIYSHYFMPINPKARPGGDLNNIFPSKDKSWATAASCAEMVLNTLKHGDIPNWTYYTLGQREKRNKNKRSGDLLEARVVMQQDQVEYLMARPYTIQIENLLKSIYDTPIIVGRSMANKGYHYNFRKYKIWNNAVEFDWSLFDSSQRSDIIIGAFALARGLFPISDYVDKCFNYFCTGLLDKYVLQNDGNFFNIKQGLPSGNVWTTIINSFANCILCELMVTGYRGLGKNIEFDYQVSGDDGVLFFDKEFTVDIDKYTKWIEKKFDMQIKFEYCGPSIGTDPDKSPVFLKTTIYWENDKLIVTTPPKSLVTRLSAQQKNYTNIYKLSNFLFAQTETILGHVDCKELVSSYYAWVLVNEMNVKDRSFCQIKNDYWYVCERFNDKIYHSDDPNPLCVLLREVSGDRILPYQIADKLDKVDNITMLNWFLDNTYHGYSFVANENLRFKWFKMIMGDCFKIERLINLAGKKWKKFCRYYMIPIEVYSDIRKWYLNNKKYF